MHYLEEAKSSTDLYKSLDRRIENRTPPGPLLKRQPRLTDH
jgi:hypothetical protein